MRKGCCPQHRAEAWSREHGPSQGPTESARGRMRVDPARLSQVFEPCVKRIILEKARVALFQGPRQCQVGTDAWKALPCPFVVSCACWVVGHWEKRIFPLYFHPGRQSALMDCTALLLIPMRLVQTPFQAFMPLLLGLFRAASKFERSAQEGSESDQP